ncbi:hypothetical protein STXM2123_2900 [Streptomyces sp. F-3]|nr:hypothetical protein STXM2123_2900 [Streptomyces sp. F-3]
MQHSPDETIPRPLRLHRRAVSVDQEGAHRQLTAPGGRKAAWDAAWLAARRNVIGA